MFMNDVTEKGAYWRLSLVLRICEIVCKNCQQDRAGNRFETGYIIIHCT